MELFNFLECRRRFILSLGLESPARTVSFCSILSQQNSPAYWVLSYPILKLLCDYSVMHDDSFRWGPQSGWLLGVESTVPTMKSDPGSVSSIDPPISKSVRADGARKYKRCVGCLSHLVPRRTGMFIKFIPGVSDDLRWHRWCLLALQAMDLVRDMLRTVARSARCDVCESIYVRYDWRDGVGYCSRSSFRRSWLLLVRLFGLC